MPVFDINDFENKLVELMEGFYGSVDEAMNKRGEFLYTVRDDATQYLRNKYGEGIEASEYPEFNRRVQMAYVNSMNKLINEYVEFGDVVTKSMNRLDSRAVADF